MSTRIDEIQCRAEFGPGSVKHRSIYEVLEASIVEGRYQHGEKLPTEGELVKAFGVSRTTISRAMRDLQHAGLLERRRGAGSFVTRSVSDDAVSLVGVVMAMHLGPHSIFGNILRPIERAAHSLGWKAMISQSAHTSERPEQNATALVENLERLGMLGVVFAPGGHGEYEDRFNRSFVKGCDAVGIALVLLDRDIERFPFRSRYDLVSVDNVLGAYQLTRHLVEAGCRRILCALEATVCPSTDARLAGRDLALRDAELPSDSRLTLRFDLDHSETVVERVIEIKPDAILCDNDHHAAFLLKTLTRAGLRVPDDVMLTGFDDYALATMLTPSLTTYRQPVEAIGFEAMRLLESRISHPALPGRQTLIPGEVVVRESTTG